MIRSRHDAHGVARVDMLHRHLLCTLFAIALLTGCTQGKHEHWTCAKGPAPDSCACTTADAFPWPDAAPLPDCHNYGCCQYYSSRGTCSCTVADPTTPTDHCGGLIQIIDGGKYVSTCPPR